MRQLTILRQLAHFSFLTLASLASNAYSFNMAYVEVNSNYLDNAACYIKSDNKQPLFGAVSIFAGNINGTSPNKPEIFFNSQVTALLQSSQIENLHRKGIKVFMTLLGNHQNAGWSCMTDEVAAKRFANEIVVMVNKNNLDGIDIDDEYSTCQTNNYSMIMLAQAIKSNPEFKGKLLTKALFADNQYFSANYKGHHLAEYLDYGWEMTYSNSNFNSRLSFYLQHGMQASRLMIGGWTASTYPDPYAIGKYTTQNSLAGSMVYDVTRYSLQYLTEINRGLQSTQTSVNVVPNCLH